MIADTMESAASAKAAPSPNTIDTTAPEPGSAGDYAAHLQFYRGVVKGIAIFVAHAFVILALMAYFLT